MLRSFFSALTSLRAHSSMVEITADNIANVNTVAYKGQRAGFSELFSSNLRGASGPSTTRGGLNPLQIPGGVALQKVDTNMGQGGVKLTGSVTDVAIQGEGMFRLMDAAGGDIRYIRAGNFNFDSNGDLTGPQGYYVCGRTDTDADGDIDTADAITRLNVPATARSVSIDQTGLLSYIDPTGAVVTAGRVVLSTFNNPAGLNRLGENMYGLSNNSGPENINFPTVNGAGLTIQGSLEASNVDIADEFVRLMEGQRGFQSAARVITSSDEMLQEVMNMKR